MTDSRQIRKPNRYAQIIEGIFFSHYTPGAREVPFPRTDIERVAGELGIKLPKNLGDVIYSFRFRTEFPESVNKMAPPGEQWVIHLDGRSKYKFSAVAQSVILPNEDITEIMIPDSTPGLIAKYALSDEQALLAKVRYNRLVDVFTGVTCYSLQNHLRTTVPGMGQVETDEIYIGIDKKGVHYALPVQAKGGNDILSIVQIMQDIGLCSQKFPHLICRPIAAQFLGNDLIALFAFEAVSGDSPRLLDERHYRLVNPELISPDSLDGYQQDIHTLST